MYDLQYKYKAIKITDSLKTIESNITIIKYLLNIILVSINSINLRN